MPNHPSLKTKYYIPPVTRTGLFISLFALPIILSIIPALIPTSPTQILLVDITKWGVVALLAGYVLHYENRSLTSIGFTLPSPIEIPVGVTGILVALLLVDGVSTLVTTLAPHPPSTAAQTLLASLPLIQRLSVAGTAGITEEILYRGYPIERLIEYTDRPWVAGLISICVFVGIHIPSWGVLNAASQLALAILLTTLYLRYRSLTVVILLHTGYDLITTVLAPMLH